MSRFNAERAKQVGRIVLRVLGVVAAVVTLVVGVSLLVLRTDWGGERVRRQIVSRVNQQIEGTLEIQKFSFGGNEVTVAGIVLRDPEGEIVARVGRVDVGVSVARLLRKEVRVTRVVIENPVLAIVSDDDGSNLERATAPRKKTHTPPKKPPEKTRDEGWVIRIDRFELTRGDISTAAETADGRVTQANLADLGVFASVRYATGNHDIDLTLRVTGNSQRAPAGPLRLAAQLAAHGGVYRFVADGELLNGTLAASGNVDRQRLGDADVSIALAIPRQELAGYAWGPLRVDGRANPGTSPNLDASLAIPGVQLTAKDRGANARGVIARLAVADLGLTAKAVRALTRGEVSPLGGRGELEVGIEARKGESPASFAVATKGAFEALRFGDTEIARLSVAGQAERLSSRPGNAAFDLSVASLTSGKTTLRGIGLSAKLREQDFSASFEVAGPARVDARLTGRLDDDRRGLTLGNVSIAFPGSRWTSQGQARLRADERESSISGFRLVCDQQSLAVDGSLRGEMVDAHVKLSGLELGRLPTALIDPELRLDGHLTADVTARGRTDAPQIAARVDVEKARYQGFTNIDAQLAATLDGDKLGATMGIRAPYLTAEAALNARTDVPEPGSPIDLRLDVKHLDVSQVMRAAEMAPLGDGRLNLKLRATGSADKPALDLVVQAFDLSVKRKADAPVDLGEARVHLSYADRDARAELDFKSAHGGTLVVDASTRIDLGYPRVTRRRVVPAKLPIRGKVVAKNLDVAWIAAFNPRVESMGGKVSADARLAGTVGDPQFIGDVRWKNGELVATPAPPPPAR